jgi:hypothetical protein
MLYCMYTDCLVVISLELQLLSFKILYQDDLIHSSLENAPELAIVTFKFQIMFLLTYVQTQSPFHVTQCDPIHSTFAAYTAAKCLALYHQPASEGQVALL